MKDPGNENDDSAEYMKADNRHGSNIGRDLDLSANVWGSNCKSDNKSVTCDCSLYAM